jgi:hypothetical protein
MLVFLEKKGFYKGCLRLPSVVLTALRLLSISSIQGISRVCECLSTPISSLTSTSGEAAPRRYKMEIEEGKKDNHIQEENFLTVDDMNEKLYLCVQRVAYCISYLIFSFKIQKKTMEQLLKEPSETSRGSRMNSSVALLIPEWVTNLLRSSAVALLTTLPQFNTKQMLESVSEMKAVKQSDVKVYDEWTEWKTIFLLSCIVFLPDFKMIMEKEVERCSGVFGVLKELVGGASDSRFTGKF